MFSEIQLFIGTEIVLSAEWHKPTDPNAIPDITDPLADPSTITLEILNKGVRVEFWEYGTDFEVVRDSQGKYHANYIVTLSGEHRYIWRGTGNAAHVMSEEFYVRKP